MAVVPWRRVVTPHDGMGVKLIKWENLQAGDTGQPFVVADYSDKSVQFHCQSYGSGITIQGSIDPDELGSTDGSSVGAGWDTLSDPQGNPLAGVTSDKLETLLEHPYLIRPSCSLGVTDATVVLLLASVRS